MKVLIIGSGGREHAITWKVSKSAKVTKIYCAPGNPGMAEIAECVDIKAMDIPAIVQFSKDKAIDLVIVGPEAPLIAGLADELRAAGVPTFGPSKAAAEIEGSKVFSKNLFAKYGIPTARFRTFDNPDAASAYIEELASGSEELPVVIKADGEALGKGVLICNTKTQALDAVKKVMVDKAFGKAGDRVVIEEMLEGPEASLMVITDGTSVVPLQPAQDYKRANDNDEGLNTGGMGCYSPVPVVPPEMYDLCMKTCIMPTINAMKAEGRPYTGVLYCGVMITKEGPKVIEFNARMGDPETQVVLPLLENDLIDVIQASLAGSLDSVRIKCYNGSAVGVVLASGGYPGSYETGKPVSGLQEAAGMDDVIVFHAGTKFQDSQVVTSGGRVLVVTALGNSFKTARDRAYEGVDKIHFDGMHFRKDIAQRVISDS